MYTEIKCQFLTCAAGMGVAGNGCCFLGGDPNNKNCSKYKNETEFLKEQEARRK